MSEATRHEALAASFDQAADVYARARPSYPDQALDWLVPADARRVLDLGAGTGKLTAQLLARGLEVHAVEPSDNMRAELRGSSAIASRPTPAPPRRRSPRPSGTRRRAGAPS